MCDLKYANENRSMPTAEVVAVEPDELGSQVYEFVIADRRHEGKMSLPYAEKYWHRADVYSEFQSWVYDSTGKYRKQIGRILFVAEAVRKAGRGYREFRKQLGNYENGVGIMRSEINMWCGILKPEIQHEGVKVAKYLWQLTAYDKAADTAGQVEIEAVPTKRWDVSVETTLCNKTGSIPDQPSNSSEVQHIDGETHVSLQNCKCVLVEYRLKQDGSLSRVIA